MAARCCSTSAAYPLSPARPRASTRRRRVSHAPPGGWREDSPLDDGSGASTRKNKTKTRERKKQETGPGGGDGELAVYPGP